MNRRSIFKSLTAAVVMAALDLKLTAAQFRKRFDLECVQIIKVCRIGIEPYWTALLLQKPVGWKIGDGFADCWQKVILEPEPMGKDEFKRIVNEELERRRLELEDE